METNEPRFPHLGPEGKPRMVDVSGKASTPRTATAEGRILMSRETLETVVAGRTPKGEALSVARIAGITAAKRTDELIPLCHSLPLTAVEVDLEPDPRLPGIRARATARTVAPTGAEMEALTAVSVALLTVYDMVKGVERGMVLEGIRLLRKEGGRSGTWVAGAGDPEGTIPPLQT